MLSRMLMRIGKRKMAARWFLAALQQHPAVVGSILGLGTRRFGRTLTRRLKNAEVSARLPDV